MKTKTTNSATNSGSKNTSASKESSIAEDIVVDGVPKFAKKKGPGKNGAALQDHKAYKSRMQALAPIPEGIKDPVAWAGEAVRDLAPMAVREMEYTLKFGSDTNRYQAAKDIMAINGHTTKPKDTQGPAVSMTFVHAGPVGPTGVPIMPFSNAAKRLGPAATQTLDAAVEKAHNTIQKAPYYVNPKDIEEDTES